jgi:hypothetical protein
MHRKIRTLALALSLATTSVVGLELVAPTTASALCVTPLEDGVWWNHTSSGSSKVQIELIDCGDQVLNGVRSRNRYRVDVWVRQSDGNLFHRGTFVVGDTMDGDQRWIVVRVPVGGYVEEMWMRVESPTRPAERMRVWIYHESLDAKPSYVTDSAFLRHPPAPAAFPLRDRVTERAECWACRFA